MSNSAKVKCASCEKISKIVENLCCIGFLILLVCFGFYIGELYVECKYDQKAQEELRLKTWPSLLPVPPPTCCEIIEKYDRHGKRAQ